MLHAGVDMHKRFSVVTVVDDAGSELLKGERLANDEGVISSFFEEFGEDIQVVLEAGPSWQWMCDLLDGLGLDNKLCHPLKTKAIASARIKTDKIDSRILAHLSRIGYLTTPENRQIERVPFRERANPVIQYLRSRCSLSEEYANKIHDIYRKDILGRLMSERFEDFLVRYTHDVRGDMVPIDYYDLRYNDKVFISLGNLEADSESGGIAVYVNTRLLIDNGLSEESIETVAAHQILYFSLQLLEFPCTKTPYPMKNDSAEAIVGGKLQCVFQEVPIVQILENCGFNIREVIEMQNRMKLQLLRNEDEGEPEQPGSAGFAMSVLEYIEVQLVGSESMKETFRDLIGAKNSLVVKYGDKCLKDAAAVNMLTLEGQLFAFHGSIKTLGLKDYVLAVDGRKTKSV